MKTDSILRLLRLFIARALGVVLALAIAILVPATFGVSADTDAFFFARRIVVGAITAVFDASPAILVPAFAAVMVAPGGEGRLRAMVWRSVAIGAGIGGAIALVLFVASPALMAMVIADEARAPAAARMLQAFSLSLPFALGAVALRALFEARKQAAVPASATHFSRLFLVLGLVFLTPPLALPGLTFAFSIGWATTFGLLCLLFWRTHPSSALNTATPSSASAADTGEMRARTMAIAIVVGVAQVESAMEGVFAARLIDGGLTLLELAQRLTNIVPLLIVASLFTIYLSDWSRAAAEKQLSPSRIVGAWGFGTALLAPIGVFFAVNAVTIVEIVLHHGAFDDDSARQVSHLIIAVAPTALVTFFYNLTFYYLLAAGHSRLVRAVSLIVLSELAVRFVLMWWCVQAFGLVGVPISVMASFGLVLAVIAFINRDALTEAASLQTARTAGLLVVALGLSAVAAIALRTGTLALFASPGVFGGVAATIVAGAAQVGAYGAALMLFGLASPGDVKRLIKRR